MPLTEEASLTHGMVNSLRTENGNWNLDLLNSLFDSATVQNICRIPEANATLKDKITWQGNVNGEFSIKLAFNLEYKPTLTNSTWWTHLWKSKLHDRTKFFIWKLANLGLSKASNLLACNMVVENKECVHGCDCLESKNHLFFHCHLAKVVWFATP